MSLTAAAGTAAAAATGPTAEDAAATGPTAQDAAATGSAAEDATAAGSAAKDDFHGAGLNHGHTLSPNLL